MARRTVIARVALRVAAAVVPVTAAILGAGSRGTVGAQHAVPLPGASMEDSATFAVEGQVTNGTGGGPQPLGIPVKVISFSGDRPDGSWESIVGPDGRYHVEGVLRVEGASYLVTADYQGATYVARIEPPEGGGLVAGDLTVYESVVADPGLRFELSAILISEPREPGAITVTEIHTIENSSDRTFAPRADGPGGPAGLLVFGLPTNAFDLNPGIGLHPGRLVQIGRGFASLNPVMPGRTEVSFSYRVPYSEASHRIERTVRYPVTTLRVLAPASGPMIQSDMLGAEAGVTFGGRQYQSLSGGPFGPGTAVTLTVSGLSVAGGPLATVPAAVAAALGVGVGLLAIVIHAAIRHRRPAMGDHSADHDSFVHWQ